MESLLLVGLLFPLPITHYPLPITHYLLYVLALSLAQISHQ